MSTATRTTDRLLGWVLGAVLLLGGLAVAAWSAGLADEVVSGLPQRITTRPVGALTNEEWWPWALGAVGVLLVLVGAWWLLAHVRRPQPATIDLPGSDATGMLSADAQAVAERAAAELSRRRRQAAADAGIGSDRAGAYLDTAVHLPAGQGIDGIGRDADEVSTQLRAVMGREVRYRVRVQPARSASRRRLVR